MQAWFYTGARGAQAPSLWLGPQIFEGFPVFYHLHSVYEDMEAQGLGPPRILRLELHLAICLAQ